MKQINTAEKPPITLSLPWRSVVILFFILAFCTMLIGNLTVYPLWWDEGWTLSVARTWVEHGHYGRLLNGELSPPGLEAALPVTAPVALSFKLFGVGIWQGRVFGAVCTGGAVLLMYYLALRLYNPTIAAGTLFVLLLMPMHPGLHVLTMGLQVLAEMPMLFYVLAGYACFLLTLRRSLWFLPLAILGWGIALITKAQLLPFWAVALGAALGAVLLKRQWRMAGLWIIALGGAFATAKLLVLAQGILLQGHTLPVTPIQGLYQLTALVLRPANRLLALRNGLILGLPTLLGLGYGAWEAWRWLRWNETTAESTDLASVRLSLLVLAGSWFAWYVLLSVGWLRYLFPAIFLGSFFVAAFLYHLTGHLRAMLCSRGVPRQQSRQTWRQRSGEGLAIFLVMITSILTIPNMYSAYPLYEQDNHSAQQVVDFLHSHTAADALIETYDSELHFLLNRRYHYPPDQAHVDMNRRFSLQEDVPVDYDPLAADPDYLVVGLFGHRWQVYTKVIADGSFRPLRTIGRYEVYERVR